MLEQESVKRERNTVRIIQADVDELDVTAELFDMYRVFYGQPSHYHESRHFLFDRMLKSESVIFLAFMDEGMQEKPVGFVQLYPSFSSVHLASVWILNDLFVVPSARRQGVAQSLIKHVIEFARNTQARSVLLETATDNHPAQCLYDSLGFRLDRAMHHYSLDV
jgi:ribosomal protein S18 acetylase RimI-like enzyme